MYVQLDIWDEPLGWIRSFNEALSNKWRESNWVWDNEWNQIEVDTIIYEELASTFIMNNSDITVLAFLKEHCLVSQLGKTVIIIPV
jgi:hypothetical protein